MAKSLLELVDLHADTAYSEAVAWETYEGSKERAERAQRRAEIADRVAAVERLAAEYAAHNEPGERAEVPVDELLAALNGEAESADAVDLDDFREHAADGWYFRFPNRWTASVRTSAPFRFDIQLGIGADAETFAVEHGGTGDAAIANLTSEAAERIVRQLAALPTRTTDDINGTNL